MSEMIICKTCGVELEDGVEVCPVCETRVENGSVADTHGRQQQQHEKSALSGTYLLRRILWQITSLLLLSGILGTLIIDLSAQRVVTWSIYPVAICLMIFSYASVMALWHSKLVSQVMAGWIISVVVLLMIYWSTNAVWTLKLALPILCALNLICLILVFIIGRMKGKSLNTLAVILIAVAVFCMMTEGILSLYFVGTVKLRWSVIVAACLLPVTVALLFMYFKTRNNPVIQKIFHT